MASKFKIGDKVRVVKETALLPLGLETEIIAFLDDYPVIKFKDNTLGYDWTLEYTDEYFELLEG